MPEAEAGPEREEAVIRRLPAAPSPSEGRRWVPDFTESTPSRLNLGSNSHNSGSSLVPIFRDVMVLRFPLLAPLCGPELWQGHMALTPPYKVIRGATA